VIGGLLVATFYTLFFVPVVYSLLQRKPPLAALRTGKEQPEKEQPETEPPEKPS
jgi:hypothetical protein